MEKENPTDKYPVGIESLWVEVGSAKKIKDDRIRPINNKSNKIKIPRWDIPTRKRTHILTLKYIEKFPASKRWPHSTILNQP